MLDVEQRICTLKTWENATRFFIAEDLSEKGICLHPHERLKNKTKKQPNNQPKKL